MIITLLDVLSFVVEWAYALLFFWILHTFLPVRKPWPLRLAAVVVCAQLPVVGVYVNDLPALLAAMLGFRDQQLVAILVMTGSSSAVSCFIMAKNMGHEGVLTSSVVMMTTLGSAFTLTAWLYVLRMAGLV